MRWLTNSFEFYSDRQVTVDLVNDVYNELILHLAAHCVQQIREENILVELGRYKLKEDGSNLQRYKVQYLLTFNLANIDKSGGIYLKITKISMKIKNEIMENQNLALN